MRIALYRRKEKKRIEEENERIDICFNGFTEEEKKATVAYLERMCKNLENYKWVTKKDLEHTYAIPTAFQSFRKVIIKKEGK